MAEELSPSRHMLEGLLQDETTLILNGQVYSVGSQGKSDHPLHWAQLLGWKWPLYESECLDSLDRIYINDNEQQIRKCYSSLLELRAAESSSKIAEACSLKEKNPIVGFAFSEDGFFNSYSLFSVVSRFSSKFKNKILKIENSAFERRREEAQAKNYEIDKGLFKGVSAMALDKILPNSDAFLSYNGRICSLKEFPNGEVGFNGKKFTIAMQTPIQSLSSQYPRVVFESIKNAVREVYSQTFLDDVLGVSIAQFKSAKEALDKKRLIESGNVGILREGDCFYAVKWINNKMPYSLLSPDDGKGYIFDTVQIGVRINALENGSISAPDKEIYVINGYEHPFLKSTNGMEKICIYKDGLMNELERSKSTAEKYKACLDYGEKTLLSGYFVSTSIRPWHNLNDENFGSAHRKFENSQVSKRPAFTNVV